MQKVVQTQGRESFKVILLYGFLALFFLIFLGKMAYINTMPKDFPSLISSEKDRAIRGTIISADGYTIASSQKLYKAAINTKNINPDNKELFITLFFYL